MADSETAGWTQVVLPTLVQNTILLLLLMAVQSMGGRVVAWPGLVVGVGLGLVRGAFIRAAVRAAGPELLATPDRKLAQEIYGRTEIGRAVRQVSGFLMIGLAIFVFGAMIAMYNSGLGEWPWLMVRSVVPAYFTMSLVSWLMQLPLPNGGRVVEANVTGR